MVRKAIFEAVLQSQAYIERRRGRRDHVRGREGKRKEDKTSGEEDMHRCETQRQREASTTNRTVQVLKNCQDPGEQIGDRRENGRRQIGNNICERRIGINEK